MLRTILLLGLMYFVGAAKGQGPAEKSLIDLAPRIDYLCGSGFLQDWDAKSPLPLASPAFLPWKQRLIETENLLPLLRHSNPKVRTLAIVGLASKDDPQLLPALEAIADDQGSTYPCPIPTAQAFLSDAALTTRPMQAQTVGDIAKAIVNAYLQEAGYHYGIRNATGQPGFNAYWAAHKNRAYSASWFAVRLERTHGSHAVLGDVSRLPASDRQWELLYLAARQMDFYGHSKLVSDSELIENCRELGRERLLSMLAGHVPSTDPDLQPRRMNNWPYNSMVRAILQRCTPLFAAQDSSAFLNDESIQRDLVGRGLDPAINAWWAIAAANLDRNHATAILHAAFARFSDQYSGLDRARIAGALWELGGAPEQNFVLDWFYHEPLAGCCVTPRRIFLESLGAAPGGWQRLASLVADPRFDSLDWVSLDYLVRIVNQRSKQPYITEAQLQEAWHSYGMGFEGRRERAMKEYPQETQHLLSVLAEWRKKIRATAPAWGQAGPPWKSPE